MAMMMAIAFPIGCHVSHLGLAGVASMQAGD